MLDRIDLHIDVPALDARTLTKLQIGEPSERIRARVLDARERQLKRFADRPALYANAHLGPREVREFCAIDDRSLNLLRAAVQKLGLSARAYHRVLRLARTIANLDGSDAIAVGHIAEAIQYRSLDRRPVSPTCGSPSLPQTPMERWFSRYRGSKQNCQPDDIGLCYGFWI